MNNSSRGLANKNALVRAPFLFLSFGTSRRLLPASDAHGHDDVAIPVGLIGERAHLAGGLLVLQLDAYRAIGGRGQKIKHVRRIETDGDRVTLVILLNVFLGLAVLRTGCGYLHAFFRDRELDGMRALVR